MVKVVDIVSEVSNESGGVRLRLLGWILVAACLIGILIPVAALTFSVRVTGLSMSPTLAPDDRLLMNVLARDRVQRFDLVHVQFGNGRSMVKRVIGMPGDSVIVRINAGVPVVRVTPAGADRARVVDNPAWTDQPGDNPRPCCGPDGLISGEPMRVTIPDGHYWVVGDNWGGSDDSRDYGFITEAEIAATLNVRLLPWSGFGRIDNSVSLR
ncbi:signal peptidase I [Nocardioides limicola]|uniref:signal peptidase I n=1 Tax=Nocardioides limicola TaxID=2803368 RepID=UPI00193B30F2|nr:signal peptidase I [Nocardioides sp. DJM-14]